MPGSSDSVDWEWSCEQIARFRQVRPRYEQYAATLREVLEQVARRLAPYAMVQTRPKAIASFAEKIQRKSRSVRDPVNDFTDLCGGRVITFTQDEVKAVCEYIRDHFEIDWNNSVAVGQRLKTNEFGYRSQHYIVQFKRGVFPNEDVPVEIPDEVYGLKAEIQVRTLLEHAWAVFSHDRAYKGAFAVPARWERELAGLSALLEQADEAFCRIEAGLQTYAASYGAYMTEEQMRSEMALLENVLACDPDNPALAHRIGKLAMTLGDWPAAVAVLERYLGAGRLAIVRDLGVSLCQLHSARPDGAEYRRGQQLLERACRDSNPDPDALASLAGTWKRLDPDKARTYYRKAYEVAPSDPYAVGNFLVSEIEYRRDTSAVPLMAPAIRDAMQRCHDQLSVGMNVPWAYYSLGTFHLALGQPYESIAAYANGIRHSTDWMVETSLETLKRLAIVRRDLPGYDWLYRLLVVALAGKYGKQKQLGELSQIASSSAAPLARPVVVLAGSSDAGQIEQMAAYRQMLLDAFGDYRGVVVSGGTTAGIGGLAGDLQEAYGEVRVVGHVPNLIPTHVTLDRRYRELRTSPGQDFDPIGPLQMWADVVSSGIDPKDVKLLGIGGGRIAAVEYRIALALGARVGILEGSGRSAAQLLNDPEWNDAATLQRLPLEAGAIHDFASPPLSS